MTTTVDSLASEVLKVVPSMMRTIKKKWKRGQIYGVTQSQFHLLLFIENNPGASLLDVAKYLGMTSPSASASVDEMVIKELLCREGSRDDRRKITLTITQSGQNLLDQISEQSKIDLAPHLQSLTDEERLMVFDAMKLLEPLFSKTIEAEESSSLQTEAV